MLDQFLSDTKVIWAGLSIIGSMGVAWGAARQRVNNAEKHLKSVSDTLKAHTAEDHAFQVETAGRLGGIETEVKRLRSIEHKLDRVLENR